MGLSSLEAGYFSLQLPYLLFFFNEKRSVHSSLSLFTFGFTIWVTETDRSLLSNIFFFVNSPLKKQLQKRETTISICRTRTQSLIKSGCLHSAVHENEKKEKL